MLVIRLQRTGRENLPTYRVVVAKKSDPVKGKFLEIVGHYLPQRGTESLTVKQERIGHWVKNGAIPSDTVARLLKRSGQQNMDKFIKRYTKRKPKGEEAAAPVAPVAAAPTPEAPKEAPPAEAAAPQSATGEAPATSDSSGEALAKSDDTAAPSA